MRAIARRAGRRRRCWTIGSRIAAANLGSFHLANGPLGATGVAKLMAEPADELDFRRSCNELNLVEHLARLGHVELLGAGCHRGRPFYVTPRMRRSPPIEGQAAARLVADHVVPALAVLHTLGVAHRDVRPHNILWSGAKPLLVDFGLAQLLPANGATFGSGLIGSVPYMAPEVVRGEPAGAGSDVWALGVTIHRFATGRLVHRGLPPDNVADALAAVAKNRPVVSPGLPPDLGALVAGCLDIATRRFSDATAVMAARTGCGTRVLPPEDRT